MHLRRHDTTGKLLRICMRWHQLEAGVSLPFYRYEYGFIASILTPTWIKHLYECTSSCHATFVEHDQWVYKATRENDFLLQELVQLSNLSDDDKTKFNEIRMCLEVLTAFDSVTLGSSTKILKSIKAGINMRHSSLTWPECDPFPPSWITIWNQAIDTIFSPALQRRPLGKWIH